jgi:hypothetical protein
MPASTTFYFGSTKTWRNRYDWAAVRAVAVFIKGTTGGSHVAGQRRSADGHRFV